MQANHRNNRKPFLIVLYTFLLLLVVSIAVPERFWVNKRYNAVNILADLKPSKKSTGKRKYKPAPRKEELKQLVKDTIITNKEVANIIRNDVAIEVNDSNNSNEGLTNFLTALQQLQKQKRKKVRIGYFGDSMIEGDLITQTIRSILQNKYGGNGVGFIPPTSVVAHFRQTVKVTASEHWEDIHFFNNKKKLILGLSGHTFFAKEGATINIKPGGGKHLSSLYDLSILYGATGEQTNLAFTLNSTRYQLTGNKQFNSYQVNADTPLAKAQLVFQQGETPIYGFSAESKTGVILDNLSFRGSSGVELIRLTGTMLKQIDSIRPYDLIVLHYGPNLLYADSIVYFGYYQKQLSKTVQHLKKAFPKASILIISTADKAFKIDGVYRTGDGVEALLAAQQQVANKFNCAFFNLYEAMGGYNSMKAWVEKHPILAGIDYTHFNQSGSAKIGRLIANAILNEYEKKYPAQ
jgi:lysophospholipase L1-like esterase